MLEEGFVGYFPVMPFSSMVEDLDEIGRGK